MGIIEQGRQASVSERPRFIPQSEWPALFRVGDRHVLAALGICPPKILPHGREVLVGVGRVPGCDNATVAVYVSAFPARFWRIVICRKDQARFELKAGTVELQKLWSTIELVCRGMLDVRITWPSDSQASCERLDQGEELPPPAPLPLVSLGQGAFAHDLAGKPTDVETHSRTQPEVDALVTQIEAATRSAASCPHQIEISPGNQDAICKICHHPARWRDGMWEWATAGGAT